MKANESKSMIKIVKVTRLSGKEVTDNDIDFISEEFNLDTCCLSKRASKKFSIKIDEYDFLSPDYSYIISLDNDFSDEDLAQSVVDEWKRIINDFNDGNDVNCIITADNVNVKKIPRNNITITGPIFAVFQK